MDNDQKYHDFDANAIEDVVASVQSQPEMTASLQGGGAASLDTMMESTSMYVGAHCISVTVENNRVCLNLPRPISKKICVPVPRFIPNGQKVKACIGVCFKGPFPTGVKATVAYNGNVFFRQSWGIC